MLLVFNFLAGLLVGFLLCYISVLFIVIAWSMWSDLCHDRMEKDIFARFYRTKTERRMEWIFTPPVILLAILGAIVLPANFVEHNKDNSAILLGGLSALICVAFFLASCIWRKNEKKKANQALESTSTAVTPPAVAGDRASGTRGSS
jgi:H+/gluconate symporter-like permease